MIRRGATTDTVFGLVEGEGNGIETSDPGLLPRVTFYLSAVKKLIKSIYNHFRKRQFL